VNFLISFYLPSQDASISLSLGFWIPIWICNFSTRKLGIFLIVALSLPKALKKVKAHHWSTIWTRARWCLYKKDLDIQIRVALLGPQMSFNHKRWSLWLCSQTTKPSSSYPPFFCYLWVKHLFLFYIEKFTSLVCVD